MIEKGEPFAQWLEDVEMNVGDTSFATIDELYVNFREFMEKAGYRFIIHKNGFSQMLNRKGFIHKRHLVHDGPVSKQHTFYYYADGAHIVSGLAGQLKVKPLKNKDGSEFTPLL